ncbi:MAG: TlpA family protein disulfide reductase [Bacteroidales bacterium]|nr:TlpA family protein disulfide reductase [Bacteroidales bacterium]
MKAIKTSILALVALVGVACAGKSVEKQIEELKQWNDDFQAKYESTVQGILADSTLADEAKMQQAQEYAEKAWDEFFAHNKEILDGNKDNALGVEALRNIYSDLEDEELSGIIAGMSPEIAADPFVQKLSDKLTAKGKTAEGQMFTDFEVDGVRLSDYVGKGKYVLVDFWASWCGPCRREIPNIRKVYDEFKSDKFDVLSVAVWDKVEDTQKALEEEGLPWPQIVNAQQVPTDLYGIEGIPHIILFGPDGTILRRDLRGSGIREAVAAYVK